MLDEAPVSIDCLLFLTCFLQDVTEVSVCTGVSWIDLDGCPERVSGLLVITFTLQHDAYVV